MNSSDQGVFQLDTAFKRRWDFEYLSIDFTNYLSFEEFSDNKILIKCPEEENFSWRDFAETINTTLLKENITEDRLLGPFFLSMSELKSDKLNKIIANKVLIYLWDDVLRHETKNIIFGEDYNSFSRLQSEFIEAKNIFSDNFIESLRQHKSSISNEVNEDIVTEDDNTEAE